MRPRFSPTLKRSLTLGFGFGIAVLFLASGRALAGPYFDGLRSGLLSCQAALRGALRQSDNVQANDRLSLCEPHLDALLGNSFPANVPLSTTQKKTLIALTERQLRLVRDLSEKTRLLEAAQPGQVSATPYKARLTSFENGLRAFHERLSTLETWVLNTGLRLGVTRYLDGTLEPVGGTSAIVVLDHGSKVDAAVEISSATPLREENGVIQLAPTEGDVVAVTQAWLEFKRYRNFQFKLGIFPDTEGFFTPKRWPFASVQGRASLYRAGGLDLAASIRHDVFGVFSPQQTGQTARLFERNLTELVASFDTARSDVEWQFKTAWRLHWYTDASGRLASLSVGRQRYVSDAPAPDGTRYRISDRLAQVRATFPGEQASLAAKFEGWNNVLEGTSSRGYYLGAEGTGRVGAFDVTVEAARAEVACASLPPIAMRSALFPGTKNSLVETQVAYSPAASLQLFSRFLYARPAPHPTRGLCADITRRQIESNLPVFEMLFGFVYKVPEDAAKLD